MTRDDVTELSVDQLAERCREETEKFRQQLTRDDRYCFELFQRAIVDQDSGAWDALWVQYSPLVESWVGSSSEDTNDLVNAAFAKFWEAVTPDRFQRSFRTLPSLLNYLRVTARNLSINEARRKERETLLATKLSQTQQTSQSVENEAVKKVSRYELSEYIMKCLNTDRERLVWYLSIELGLKPWEISKEYPEQFKSPREVSRIKERIFDRLGRDYRLRRRFEEG